MRKMIVHVLVVAGLLASSAGGALASGFSIYEAGSKATALGCAFTATADDGSALFYNAAGLSFQSGRNLDLNFIGVAPQFKFTGKLDPAETEISHGEAASKVYLVPGAAYTVNANERWSYGIGLYAPFGLGVEWKDGASWVGRRISHDVQIQTVYVTPAVSYMVADGLAFAVGVDIAKQMLNLKKYTPHSETGVNAIETELDGSSKLNVTPSLGLMYRPNDKISFGAMFHFEKTMKFEEQDATLTPQAGSAYLFGSTLVAGLGGSDQIVSADLNLPHMLSLGLAYQAAPELRLEGNYVHFGWGTFESLNLDFTNDNLDQNIEFNYEDSWQVRFGATYQATETLDLMAGYVHDKSPQPLISVSPLLPDSDRNDYSFGAQLTQGDWQFSFSYMVVVGEERTNIENGEPLRHTTDYPVGSYKSLANLFGVGMRRSF